jgi:hypothetical protein
MRTLGILLAVLVALLPPCVACALCQVEGGPCSPAFDACCEDESPAGCDDGMNGDGTNPCTCGDECDERDPVTAGTASPDSEIAPPPVPAGIAPPDAPSVRAAASDRTAAEAAGPPRRLPLRI